MIIFTDSIKNRFEFFLWYLLPIDPHKYCYKKGCFNKLYDQKDLGISLYYDGNYVTRFRVCEKCYKYFDEKEEKSGLAHKFRWRK